MKTTTREYKHISCGNAKETNIIFQDKALEPGQERLLEIFTAKSSDGWILTTANGYIKKGNTKTCIRFKDFHKDLGRSDARATKGNIAKQHDSVNVEAVIEKFKKFYNLED